MRSHAPCKQRAAPTCLNREMATQETDPAQQKKTKNKPKVFAFVSVGTTAPLESDVHFTHQRTQQEVEEKKILL